MELSTEDYLEVLPEMIAPNQRVMFYKKEGKFILNIVNTDWDIILQEKEESLCAACKEMYKRLKFLCNAKSA